MRCWLVLVCPCFTDLLLFDGFVLICFFQIAQLQSNRGSISGSLPFYQRSLMKKKEINFTLKACLASLKQLEDLVLFCC